MRTAIFALVVLCVPVVAGAQTEKKAAAAAAFDHAKQLRAAGKTEEACAEFQRSQQLDPQLGTQYNLALCYETLGKLASAYVELDELSARDTNPKRRADARKRKTALAARLTRLTVIVHDPPPRLTVRRGDVDVTPLIGVTTPIDPGVYVFRAEAPGRARWEQQVDLTAEGATITVDIPPLGPEGGATEPATGEPTGGGAIEPPGGSGAAAPRDEGGGPGQREILGMSIGGAGVVATGVGLLFGFQAKGLKDDATTLCGGQLDPCTTNYTAAKAKMDDARGKAMLANIFVGVGLAAVATGVALYLTAPDDDTDTDHATALVPVAGPDGFGLALDGRF